MELSVRLFSSVSLASLKTFESPSVKRRYVRSPEAPRTTPQQRPDRRERGREQKENVPVAHGDAFALPAPPTPASSKKAARHNKNVLTTPNQNRPQTSAVSPRSKIQSASMMECGKMAALTWLYSLFVYYN